MTLAPPAPTTTPRAARPDPEVAIAALAAALPHAEITRRNLTARELQVLVGMSRGCTNAAIGRNLFITTETVKTHVRRLLRKLGARDRAHAVHRGWELGILTAGGSR